MPTYITVVPAYGRDYKTKAEVQAAYEADKDFEIVANFGPGGRYVNKSDAQAHDIKLEVRYDSRRKVVIL